MDASLLNEEVKLPTLDISPSKIGQVLVENIRLTEDEEAFSLLCQSMKRDGQLQNVVVVERDDNPGWYNLVSGFRRLRAAIYLGWDTVRASVFPSSSDLKDLYFINTVENVVRFRLSPYELAKRAVLMKEKFGISFYEYSRRIGYSEQRVGSFVRFLLLPDSIVADWKNDHPLLKTAMLEKISAMSPETALEVWEDHKQRYAQFDRKKPKRTSNHRPSATKLMALYIAIKKCRTISEESRSLALKVVEYCQGGSPDIPGVFDPRRIFDLVGGSRFGQSRTLKSCGNCEGRGSNSSGETCSACAGKGVYQSIKTKTERKS